jgi:hypothetical protein
VRKFDHKTDRCVFGVVVGVNGYLETTPDGATKGSYSLSVLGWLADQSTANDAQEFRVYVTADIKHRLCMKLGLTLTEFEAIRPEDGVWDICESLVGEGVLFYFVGPESDAANARHLFQVAWLDSQGHPESTLKAIAEEGSRIVSAALESDPAFLHPWDPAAGSDVVRDLDAPL